MSVWTLPLAVLGVGLAVGIALALLTRGRGGRDSRAERAAVKDSLMDQLRALQADKRKLEPEVFADRWARLLDRAAAALREMERVDEDGPQADSAAAAAGRRPWGTMIAALVFFALLGVGLTKYSAPRLEGGSLTGTDLSGESERRQKIEAAKAAVEADPSDLDALNTLTYHALMTGDLGAAMKWMDQCRKLDPEHPEVRTHLAILQMSIGMSAKAIDELDAALEATPQSSKALFWRGLAALRTKDREGAVGYLERALENASGSEERAMATQALGEARRPPAEVMMRGSLSLAPGTAKPTAGVLFVMVRRGDSGGGPPAAAVRLDPRGVPGQFTVTDRDLMMGGAWPESVWVDARLDADGNPSTRGPADLVSQRIGPLSAGATDVALVLSGGAGEAEAAAPVAQLSGRITVAPGTALPKTGSVFLIVRRTETPAGPPAAALRMALSEVPGTFTVGEADLMMGGAWPEQAWIQVRVDEDGNAMTHTEGDVSSPVLGPLGPGAEGIVIPLGGASN